MPRDHVDRELMSRLEQRLGRLHARQRLGIETDHEARLLRRGVHFREVDTWYSIHSVLRVGLTLSGLWWRARRNAERIVVRHHDVVSDLVPPGFDGFTLLHLTDLHADMNGAAMRHLISLVGELRYDACVLTGDFRARTFGPFERALEGLAHLREHLSGPVYGVLGNHDSIQMVPDIEAMGIRMLMNECETIALGEEQIWLAGIDDAHFFRLDNIEKAADAIPDEAFSILLSHTPEVWSQAAHAEFNLMLSGHTHGGQLCLPGSIPLTLDAKLPRGFGAGSWRHRGMIGYTSTGVGTSILPIRLNCPAEITLHHLRRGESGFNTVRHAGGA
jgi:predicted MPP superfamily phosphohydrolase